MNRLSFCLLAGHLGDVFNDGWIFPGTPAFISGKRFCVDGAALVFRPQEGDEVIGDQHPTGGRRM
jgi:peptide methionine sulfoxide reductase MsrB